MANIGELSVGVKVDDKSLNKATKEVQTEFKKTWDSVEKNFTKRTEKGASKIRSAFWGLWGLIAGVFSITAITQFTKSLFSLWSDLEEVSSKFNVVFNNSEEVRENFDRLARATNRSSLDLITFWSDLWDVLKPLWLAQEDVNELSVSLTQLAIDVASFNNATDEQVINAFRSALTGEREALKSLGIVISEADVKQKAYNLGLQEQGQELTKQQKALATYQLLLENTSDAQGDAVRTWASFANQLKWLRGAIKDVFANAWKDVAWSTAWFLKTLTVFVSSYGQAIIETIVETGKVIWWAIKDLVWAFWDLFGLIRTWSTESSDDMANFAFIFQKLVQVFWVWVKLIITLIKNLVDVVAISMGAVIEYFKATFQSIDDGWNIVKTIFIGTLKSMVDVVELWAEAIAQVFVGMAEAIVWVFKGIATNVGVAVKKAWNLAISGINSVIDAVNKLPWVDINRLTWFDDANFKPFELKVTKNVDALKKKFTDFWSDVKWNYEGIWKSFGNIASNYANATENVVDVSSEAFKNMGDDWKQFWNFVVEWNERIEKSIKEWSEKAQENAELYEKWYFSILDIIDKYKGSVDEANDKTEKQWEIAKEAIDQIKDQYDEWEKKVWDLNKASEKLAEDTKKYNQEIEDSIRSLWKELSDLTTEYEKAVWKLQTETAVDLAERSVDVAWDLADIEREVAEIKADSLEDEETKKERIADLNDKISLLQTKISENTDKTKESTKESQQLTLKKYQDQLKVLEAEGISVENQEKLAELEQQKADLLKEQQFITENTTEAQRKEAERVAWLSEAERIKEDADAEIAEKTRVFEAEKKRLEELQRINQVFLNLKKLDQESLDKLLADQRFQNFSQEEQELILKLAREKIQLTAQKDAVIALQQEVHDKTVELSNSATAIQMANITAIESEYQQLISQIDTAIAKQRQLNALRSWGAWFASGWFTWAWGQNEVAWVVHKWEWVAPKWMVNSMKPLFDNLENARSRGFADGGHTSTTNKTQNNNITVNNGVDLRSFIDYAKWKL